MRNHLNFKGIPIDGKIETFKLAVEKIGFIFTAEISPNVYEFRGTFAGFDNATLCVFTSKISKCVYRTMIISPQFDTFAYIESSYNKYKNLYINKYGTPSMSVEEFLEPYYLGDGYESLAIENNKANYMSWWNTELGKIVVSITPTMQLMFGYADNQNQDIAEEEDGLLISEDI